MEYAAPIHVVTGTGGAELQKNTSPIKPPIFEYVNSNDHGVSLLEVGGKKTFMSPF